MVDSSPCVNTKRNTALQFCVIKNNKKNQTSQTKVFNWNWTTKELIFLNIFNPHIKWGDIYGQYFLCCALWYPLNALNLMRNILGSNWNMHGHQKLLNNKLSRVVNIKLKTIYLSVWMYGKINYLLLCQGEYLFMKFFFSTKNFYHFLWSCFYWDEVYLQCNVVKSRYQLNFICDKLRHMNRWNQSINYLTNDLSDRKAYLITNLCPPVTLLENYYGIFM